MFAKLHLLSQDVPEGGDGFRWRAHPYLRMAGAVPKGPVVFDWNARQRADLESLWRDPTTEGARERLARDLAVFCDKLGWAPDARLLENAEQHGDEYMLTLSAVPPELYLLPWEVIQVGATGTYLSDYASAQVRYAMPGLEPRETQTTPPAPGVLFAWSAAGGAVPHEDQAALIRAAAEAGGVTFRELAEVDEASLQAALDAGPPSALHLLCHGLPGPEGEPPRLRWGASDRPSEITATRLARMLRRHDDAIRLVVLCACGSGDGSGDPLFMGSLAQEVHRTGIPSVVASRYSLSVPGSRVMTRALYDKLLREAWSLERALRYTRQALFRADDDGETHPGDAYGIQLYEHDTEWFVSDNDVEAERAVLASYPFGTAARPVPASGPPAAELTLRMDADPGLSGEELADKLRRVSEDDSLIVVIKSHVGRAAVSVVVHTTVDGAQRLLGAWRSKALQVAVGVIVGALILTKGITSALGGTVSTVTSKIGGAAGHLAATTGGKTTATIAAVAGKAVTAKLAVVALLGSAAVVGTVAYRAQAQPSAPVQVAAAMPIEPLPDPAPALIKPDLPPIKPGASSITPVSDVPGQATPSRSGVPTATRGCTGNCGDAPRECGNGMVEAGEQCDDGNDGDGDGCSSTCLTEIEPPSSAPSGPGVQRLRITDNGHRIAGETQILPSKETKSRMAGDGVSSATGMVRLCIATTGGVTEVQMTESTGYADYDKELLAAVRGWRYPPYTVDATSEPVCSTVEFNYTLR